MQGSDIKRRVGDSTGGRKEEKGGSLLWLSAFSVQLWMSMAVHPQEYGREREIFDANARVSVTREHQNEHSASVATAGWVIERSRVETEKTEDQEYDQQHHESVHACMLWTMRSRQVPSSAMSWMLSGLTQGETTVLHCTSAHAREHQWTDDGIVRTSKHRSHGTSEHNERAP